jgi:hypothetical protein
VARLFGGGLSAFPTLEASIPMTLAVVVGAPIAWILLALVRRRRPLVVPALVFAAAIIAATALSVTSGFFGDPTAIIVAAPVLAASVVIRVPIARERPAAIVALLLLGWLGGFVSVALVDPLTMSRLHAAFAPAGGERLDALAVGGAAAGRDGVLVDTDNAPVFVLGRSGARGILGPQSESFALALLFVRIDAPFVAVPNPQSQTGAGDRLDVAFPSLFRDGLPNYRVIYQNNTWRLFGRIKNETVSKQ